MSFPKISRTISKELERVKIQFLTENIELFLDRTKCVGCGTCARVCPKEAISRGPIGASRRFPTTTDIIPEVYDPKLCVFCGTCVYLCPFSALTLKKNGEIIELQNIPIVEKKVVPTLKFEAKKLEHSNRTVKQYAKGTIKVIDEECAGGCASCADVCPSGAITVPKKPDKGWEKKVNVVVDKDKCCFCGACDNCCPTGAIKLEITEINTSGDYSETFWPFLVERLKKLRWSKKEG